MKPSATTDFVIIRIVRLLLGCSSPRSSQEKTLGADLSSDGNSEGSGQARIAARAERPACFLLWPNRIFQRTELVSRPSVEAIGGNPIPGASSDVALYADLAPFGDNHFDGCYLLRHRVIHARARKALEAEAQFQQAGCS